MLRIDVVTSTERDAAITARFSGNFRSFFFATSSYFASSFYWFRFSFVCFTPDQLFEWIVQSALAFH